MHTIDKLIQKASTLMVKGKYQEASAAYQKVLAKDPRNVTALYNRAIILHKYGNARDALKLLRQTVDLAPDFPEAHLSFASILYDLSDLESAARHYRIAATLNPRLDRAHYRLGTILESRGDQQQAALCYARCLELVADHWEYPLAAGRVLLKQGQPQPAYPHLYRAVMLNPQENACWEQFRQAFLAVPTPAIDAALTGALTQALGQETINSRGLAGMTTLVLRKDPVLQPLYRLAQVRSAESPATAPLREVLQHPLLLALLRATLIVDPELEQALTRLRQRFLQMALSEDAREMEQPACVVFLTALATACFTNEYVFAETDEETEQVEHLASRLAALSGDEAPLAPAALALLGCYRPLAQQPFASRLAGRHQGALESLVQLQVREPLHEAELRTQISPLTPIEDSVSRAVQEQYEESPYPRWRPDSVAPRAPAPLAQILHQLFPHLPPGQILSPKRLAVLVAGCGTGHHAVQTGQRFAGADVLAIDLSRASLAYACRAAQQLGATNLTFRQGDILQLHTLSEKFHHIESCGVLHHMQDPVAGWRRLLERLHRGGTMRIDLYSEIARRAVVSAREIIAAQGVADTPAAIRRFRQQVIAGELPEALGRLLRFNDFYSTSECRDLLFHRQEHRFTLLELDTIVAELGLEFLGFELPDSSYALSYRERFPNDPSLTCLPNWHRFEEENPAMFAGMYPMWFRQRS